MRAVVTDGDGDGLEVLHDGAAGARVWVANHRDGTTLTAYTPQQALDLAKALIAAVKEVTGER